MKNKFKYLVLPAVLSMLAVTTTGCLDEAFPENGTLTGDQIAGADKNAIVASMPSYLKISSSETWDLGYASYMIFYDAMTEDYPTHNEGWDYFRYFNMQISIGYNGVSQGFWVRNYYMIQKANSVISLCNKDENSTDAFYLGQAYVFRAFSHHELARLFEYKRTNVSRLDEIAEERGIWGLTAPIVTEETTEADARVNPRAPYYEMYRFINDDLLKAEKYLADFHSAPAKDQPCLGVAYGLHARLWLDMASRFELHPEWLAEQIENENSEKLAKYEKLNITSANDCFRKAADYARLAINEGYTPLTDEEWHNTKTGFNTPNNAWLWAIILSPNDNTQITQGGGWKSIAGYKAPEATYGMSELSYGAYRMIDARLFDKIDPNDWRRNTWIDPEFAGMEDGPEKEEEFKKTYQSNTSYPYETFIQFDAYAGFKFRPGSGDGTTSTVGNVISTPLMRVEEMYLIEAEALAHCVNATTGKQALENFMNNYRMKPGTTFTCSASELSDVVDAIWTQKRIELWGEGLVFQDYKRRELQIVRGYPGTNHPKTYRYNSYPEAVAPWTNFYIPDRVETQNHTIILNPDPNQAIPTLWEE